MDSNSEALHAGQFPAGTIAEDMIAAAAPDAGTAGTGSAGEALGAGTATAPPPSAAVLFMKFPGSYYRETHDLCVYQEIVASSGVIAGKWRQEGMMAKSLDSSWNPNPWGLFLGDLAG